MTPIDKAEAHDDDLIRRGDAREALREVDAWTMLIAHAINSLPARGVGVPTDPRPANCRFRLKDEGKSYGRSSCSACGRSVFTGLGTSCHLAAIAPTDAAQAREAAMQELIDAYEDIIDYGPLVLAKKDQWKRVEAAKEKLK